jgi:hypothetical protein
MRQIKKCLKSIEDGTCVLTQEEAHKICEYPDFNMVPKYVNVTKFVMAAAFYHGTLPMGTVYVIFTLLITYCLDKHHIVKRSSFTREMGP